MGLRPRCDACDAGGLAIDANPDVDEDLDGSLDGNDDCPGVPSPDQQSLADNDTIGDACDTTFTATKNVAHYLFDDVADAAQFTTDGSFTFGQGFVNITRSSGYSYLTGQEMPPFTRGKLTVEARSASS